MPLPKPPVVKTDFKDLSGLDETRADHRVAADQGQRGEHQGQDRGEQLYPQRGAAQPAGGGAC